MYLHDLETVSTRLSSVGRSLVWFLEYPKGFLLPKFQILSNFELQLKPSCKIIAEWKWCLHQFLSKCKQNTVYRIMKDALIKKWQQRFAVMKGEENGGYLETCQVLAINFAQKSAGCPAVACRLSGHFVSQIAWALVWFLNLGVFPHLLCPAALKQLIVSYG